MEVLWVAFKGILIGFGLILVMKLLGGNEKDR